MMVSTVPKLAVRSMLPTRQRSAAWLAFGLLCALPALGQTDTERFGLFAACRPMAVVVGDLSTDASEIGLTEGSIQTAAESRLRAARLYQSESPINALLVEISVVGSAFNIDVDFVKWVRDAHGKIGIARTWGTETTGTHGRSGNYIMSALSQDLDKFILKYLQVNEAECPN